jgi:hypothetical protein
MPIKLKPLKEDIGKKSILHAILFPKLKFSLNDAKKWLENHNYKYIHNRQTKNIWRFRIKEQIKGYDFFTKVLDNGIELVFMKNKNI